MKFLKALWSVTKGIFKVGFGTVRILFWTVLWLVGFVSRLLATFIDYLEEACMTVARICTGLLLMIATIAVFTLAGKAPYYQNAQRAADLPPLKMSEVAVNPNQRFMAVIKLLYRNQFHCSATVISDIYALTAAHCVTIGSGMMTDSIDVRTSDGEDVGVKANAVGMLPSQDVALLKGDFQQFRKAAIETDPRGIFAGTGPFVACGFPGGDKSICLQFIPRTNNRFLIIGDGYLYQGMSGGPVIDQSTGHIVAVNSQVNDHGVSVGPTVGFLSLMGVAVEPAK